MTTRADEVTEVEFNEEPGAGIPRNGPLRILFDDLVSGLPISDFRFDAIYPEVARRMSATHWTPVDVARRAAQLLDIGAETRVLDVGSGAGKFCMVAALATEGTYVGVEQRPHLVKLARSIVAKYRIPRVSYLHARMEDMDWLNYTGFYLYNPFIENLYEERDRIDNAVEFSPNRFHAQVHFVQSKLTQLPLGTRIVTYHGLGGQLTPGYMPKVRERWGDDYLILWVREW